MYSLAAILSGTILVNQVQAQGQIGDSCDASSKCWLSSYGCVDDGSGAGTKYCQNSCTSDSDCLGSNTFADASDYTCDPAGNSGAGECSIVHCSTSQQCKDRHGGSDSWKCDNGACTLFAGCECDDDCKNDYYGKIVGGTVAAAVIAVIFLVAASVPCCCAVDLDKPMCPKIVGGISIVVGIFCIFIPGIASYGAADGATNDTCDKCTNGCTDEEKESIKTVLTGLGVLVAYTVAYGFVACVLGPVAAAVGCCAICPCCGPLKTKQEARKAGQSPPAAGTVVGQPADQA